MQKQDARGTEGARREGERQGPTHVLAWGHTGPCDSIHVSRPHGHPAWPEGGVAQGGCCRSGCEPRMAAAGGQGEFRGRQWGRDGHLCQGNQQQCFTP